MLKTCPECEHLVSEKAYTCPNCGYPLMEEKYNSKPRKKPRGHRRLPNGFGQITKISGRNLANPYRVMVTVGKDDAGRPICKLLKPKAYFPTYNDAYAALTEYNRDPFDLASSTTMDELFRQWICEHNVRNPRSIDNIKMAWAYCGQIYAIPVQSIRPRHFKNLVNNPYKIVDDEKVFAGGSTLKLLKSTINQLCDYAMSKDLMIRNYARETPLENPHKPRHHISFTSEEMESLWNLSKTNKWAKMIVFQCYMGWRPSEMLNIKRCDVNLDDMTIIGGLKTEAGINRTVPIHSKIQGIFYDFWRSSEGKEWLFPSPCKERTTHLSYGYYKDSFKITMRTANCADVHTAHDCRKQFVTMAKNYNVDEYALKRLVGHAIDDITESVYTDRPVSWLREEIEKIK
jgi:integrase